MAIEVELKFQLFQLLATALTTRSGGAYYNPVIKVDMASACSTHLTSPIDKGVASRGELVAKTTPSHHKRRQVAAWSSHVFSWGGHMTAPKRNNGWLHTHAVFFGGGCGSSQEKIVGGCLSSPKVVVWLPLAETMGGHKRKQG
jgi:hypothetical protein